MKYYKTFWKGFLQSATLYISSDFGKRLRKDGTIQSHNGIDIAVPQGTVLRAPLSGTIIASKVQKNKAGLYVTLRHYTSEGGYLDVFFMHMHKVESNIIKGYEIKEGEKIGLTGGAIGDVNAGRSTGAHLHLEIRENGVIPIDPKYYFLNHEKLVYKINGAQFKYVGTLYPSFDASSVKTQASYTYSSKNPSTVETETEYEEIKTETKETTVSKRLAPGIWQIIKIIIDSSIEQKQVLDSGISTQTGSLLNFFKKICQEPLVEFSGDTFGNQYYFYARKPPFDKESLLRMMEQTNISLSDENIISTNLTWSNSGIYSWYQYVPYADLLGVKETAMYIPVIFFPEYASVWGSKPLSVQSTYFNWFNSGKFDNDKEKNKANNDRIVKNAIKDLKFLIESNAYNPFTRRGTITIMGDRRIKRGTFIKHTSGEYFYVDAVTNNYSVNIGGVQRTTTLSVSKGLFPEYINGFKTDYKDISYFNIIDFGKDFDINKVTLLNCREYMSKWKVNLDSFGYFMSKRQLIS